MTPGSPREERERPWPPTKADLQRSVSYHFSAYRPEDGREEELLSKLVEAGREAEQQEGVLQTNVYRLAHGAGPDFLVVMAVENPGVVERMSRSPHFQSLDEELRGRARKVSRGAVSSLYNGRLKL